MPKRKKKKMTFAEPKSKKDDLAEQIEKSVKGLWYMSETDAEIMPFIGNQTEAVTKENLLTQIEKQLDTPVEERDFTELFERLTKMQDWFGDEEKETAEKFSVLRNLLETNLKDLKVFKVGKIELDVYVVGLDSEGNLMGIQTKAVET